MNAFHYIQIVLILVLHAVAWADLPRKRSKEGFFTVMSFVVFVTLIILSAVW